MLSIARVLLAGGDEASLSPLRRVLESADYEVVHSPSPSDAARRIGAGEVEVVIVTDDLVMALTRLVEAHCPSAPATFIVAGSAITAEWTRAALAAGASDVIDTTAEQHALLVAVERAAREMRLRRELAMLRARVGDAARQALIGRSAAITHVRDLVGRAAASQAPVLVTGEAGTGKSVVARLVHELSERAAGPLVATRCAGADTGALEAELFGRAGGEGMRARAGLFESTRGGTIVLEDAPELPPALQVQLARASATRTSRRVGASDEELWIDVRLVLTAQVSNPETARTSIDDLISRFNALVIDVPPLRERRSDIPLLVQHFRQRLAIEQGYEVAPLAPDAMLPLLGHEWTGNVRELEQWVERSAMTAQVQQPRADSASLPGVDLSSSQATLEQLERTYILHVLALESGHQSRTAARLGIDRRTLYRKLKQYRSAH